MRLDFNVLWVDDQPKAVDSQITSIKRKMAEDGFNFNPKKCKSIEEVKTFITGDLFRDQIDLVLVDWDLGENIYGQDVIKRIRQLAPYKDIVFYSALTPAATLRKLAFEQELEGIYCATRTDLVDEVIGIFKSLVRRVLDIDHTRGIVMGATSDIDHMVYSCLLSIEAKRDNSGKMHLLNQAIDRVQKRVRDITEKGEKLSSATNVETILKEHLIFNTNDRLRMLLRLLENDQVHTHKVDAIKSYLNDVVPKRNMLGHVVLAPEGGSRALVNAEGKQISLDDMRMLRKRILDLRENFRTLVDTLRA